MTKHELAKEIARAYFPPHYSSDSPAVQGKVAQLMKRKKVDLQELYERAISVLNNRLPVMT